MQALPTTDNYWLVLVSVLTSIVACYAAFSLAERMASSRGRAYFYWLASGATAMGAGIWSMHYLGMLSVRLPVEVVYHVPTVLLSLLLAVFAAAVVLVVVSRGQFTALHGTGGSLLMGIAIGGMHYTGMHAMRCAAMHHYQPLMVALSILTRCRFFLARSLDRLLRPRPFGSTRNAQGRGCQSHGPGHRGNALHGHGRGYV